MATVVGVVAKALVRDAHGQVLILVRSSRDEHRPGDFDLPGGGVELGESPAHAVAREVQEEAGLTAVSTRLLCEAPGHFDAKDSFDGQAHDIVRVLFLVEVASSEVVLSNEHQGFLWVTPHEAAEKLSHTSWGPMLRTIQNDL